ncbi:MAG: MFS transporter [Dehalococcoidia bacterium]
MAQSTMTAGQSVSNVDPNDKLAAGSVIGAHALQHAYQHGFYLILPLIYSSMALSPAALGLIETSRRLFSGGASMGGGFILDRFQHKRIAVLYGSLIVMGFGYLAVGLAPNYYIILLAAGLAGAAGSIWHPAAIGLLSQRYPERRGFVVSLHRSLGSVGDTAGPLIFGGLLIYFMWQGILLGALPLSLLFASVLWMVLRNSSTWQTFNEKPRTGEARPWSEQFRSLGGLFQSRGLVLLLLVSGLAGLGQGGLLLWLPTYLQETQGMGSGGQGIHLALLTGLGIATGPFIGGLSDRIGRKPVIIGVLATKAFIATLMALAGGGILLTIAVAMMGLVMFGVNSLVQAGALDIAEGRKLEGSMIGLLWGFNALFVGFSPLFLGFLIGAVGFGILFWYIALMNLIALCVAFVIPATGKKKLAATA